MLDSFEDKSAYALCVFSLCLGPGHEPITFEGKTEVKTFNSLFHRCLQHAQAATHAKFYKLKPTFHVPLYTLLSRARSFHLGALRTLAGTQSLSQMASRPREYRLEAPELCTGQCACLFAPCSCGCKQPCSTPLVGAPCQTSLDSALSMLPHA